MCSRRTVSTRGDQAELGQMRSHCIDQLRALTHQQIVRSMQHQYSLLLGSLVTGTNRMLGRLTASQIAAASAASFLLRLTYAFT
jgi:hypothetical protein